MKYGKKINLGLKNIAVLGITLIVAEFFWCDNVHQELNINKISSKNTDNSFVMEYSDGSIVNREYGSFKIMLDDNMELFMTGVKESSINGVKKAMEDIDIEVLERSRLYLQNSSFIDAEKNSLKKSEEVPDESFCWAACCANMLEYLGFGRVVSSKNRKEDGIISKDEDISDFKLSVDKSKDMFECEDDIFLFYKEMFYDEPGNVAEGLKYFFTGEYELEGLKKPNFKGYLPEEFSSVKISELSLEAEDNSLISILEGLQKGDAVSIAVTFVQNQTKNIISSHSITVFGYIVDLKSNEPIYIVVSDSNDSCNSNPYNSPNRYKFLHLKVSQDDGQKAYSVDYYGEGSTTGYITSAYILSRKCLSQDGR